jgi:SpoIIAA-like
MVYFTHFDANVRALVSTVKGSVVSKEFRKTAMDGLELMVTQKATKILLNIGELGVMSLEDQQWLQKEWNPKALEAGLRYQALVIPKDVFGKMAVQRVQNDLKRNQQITIQYFENEAKALEWLAGID